MKSLITIALLYSVTLVLAETPSKIMLSEWKTLRTFVSSTTPDGTIGPEDVPYPTYYKTFEGYEVIWRISNDEPRNEVIRIFRNGQEEGESDFSITYHKSRLIVPGEVVLRRFVGNEPYGWRNDTVNFATGAYYGSQGNSQPLLTDRARAIVNEWNINLFWEQ